MNSLLVFACWLLLLVLCWPLALLALLLWPLVWLISLPFRLRGDDGHVAAIGIRFGKHH